MGRAVVVVSLVAGYAIAFVLVEPSLGDGVLPLSIIPILVAAWAYGLRGGTLAGIALVGINIMLMQSIGKHDGFRPAQLPRVLTALGLGITAGRVRDLGRRQRELLDENLRVSEALRINTQDLERVVAERTQELVRTNQDLITEMKTRSELEARAASADRLAQIGTLTAGIGHEINNPLAAVIANLEVIAAKVPPDDAAMAEATRDAQDAAARVAAIARDMRTFTQPSKPGLEAAELRRAIDSTVRMVANEIRQRARLELDIVDTPPVRMPMSQLCQVLLNVLINAFQALGQGAGRHAVSIKVRGSADGEMVQIWITDTGPGIAEEHRHRVFDPFFTTKPIGVGTGLGLWVCHQIVTAASGRLSVESTLGEGTSFLIELPAAPITDQVASEPATLAVRRARILVIDDDPIVGRAVERLVRDRHDVIVADDPLAAFARIAAGDRFDVILSDVMMPELDGVSLFHKVKEVAPAQADRIVFMSGGAFTSHALAFLEQPGRKRLDKPFSRKDLEGAIARVLEIDASER